MILRKVEMFLLSNDVIHHHLFLQKH